MSAGMFIIVTITLVFGCFITKLNLIFFRNYGLYNHNSEAYEPEVESLALFRFTSDCLHVQVHAAIFSAVLSLVGLVVVLIMFTNKILIILKHGGDRGKLGMSSMTIEQSVVNSHVTS